MRADLYLASEGYVKSRQQAKNLIEGGKVIVDGVTLKKASESIDEGLPHSVELTETDKFVGRGGLKLEGALEKFGIDVTDFVAVDIGASTGGFTDCLLQRGAKQVYAVDSGHDQLAGKLREDKRVVNIEGFNARRLCDGMTEGLPTDADIAVMDVSFISQTYIIPGIPRLLREGGYYVGLVKPQFEAGRSAVGKNGIVKNKKYHIFALRQVIASAYAAGFGCVGLMRSPIEGGDGNTEYLAAFVLGHRCEMPTDKELSAVVQ